MSAVSEERTCQVLTRVEMLFDFGHITSLKNGENSHNSRPGVI